MLEASELRQMDDAWFQGFQPPVESLLHAKIPREEEHLRRLLDAVYALSTDVALHQQAKALCSASQRQRRRISVKSTGEESWRGRLTGQPRASWPDAQPFSPFLPPTT
jgi:hypothetical protein